MHITLVETVMNRHGGKASFGYSRMKFSCGDMLVLSIMSVLSPLLLPAGVVYVGGHIYGGIQIPRSLAGAGDGPLRERLITAPGSTPHFSKYLPPE